jgi:hypothetical protein
VAKNLFFFSVFSSLMEWLISSVKELFIWLYSVASWVRMKQEGPTQLLY